MTDPRTPNSESRIAVMDLGFIERDKFQELRLELEKITNPLNSFYNTLTK